MFIILNNSYLKLFIFLFPFTLAVYSVYYNPKDKPHILDNYYNKYNQFQLTDIQSRIEGYVLSYSIAVMVLYIGYIYYFYPKIATMLLKILARQINPTLLFLYILLSIYDLFVDPKEFGKRNRIAVTYKVYMSYLSTLIKIPIILSGIYAYLIVIK